MMLRVFVVGDVRLYREGLASRLRRIEGVRAESVPDHGTLRARLVEDAPDVVLLDVASPDSLDLARAVVSLAPDARIVALGVRETEEEVLPCIEAGIAGYVTRDGTLDDLVDVVESVRRGEGVVSRAIAGSLLRRIRSLAAGSVAEGALTPREHEVASMLALGNSNKHIARALGITVATVKNHVHAILRKLDVERRGQVGAALRRFEGRAPAWRRAQSERADRHGG